MQKQHVDIHRKLSLRKTLLEKAGNLEGAFYVPFIGDGDIADALYQDRKIFGADNDPARVETAKTRLPDAEIVEVDCDTFPFSDRDITYSLADFDSYSYPYAAFRDFWKHAKKTSPFILFFTDGERQAIDRTGHWTDPRGVKRHDKTLEAKRKNAGLYYAHIIIPWFEEFIKPWKIVEVSKYLRGWMCYWGAIVENPESKRIPIENGAVKANHQKLDNLKKTAYVEQIKNGLNKGQAAQAIGIDHATVSHHLARYPDFALAVSQAQLDSDRGKSLKVEDALFEAATSGNVVAIQVWLYNRCPERWADKRNIAITGKDGGPFEQRTHIEFDPASLAAALSILRDTGGVRVEAAGKPEPPMEQIHPA